MNSLQQDHELAEKSHRKVDDLGRSWLANGRLSSQDAERLATVLRQVVELYCRHIRMEDTGRAPQTFCLHLTVSQWAPKWQLAAVVTRHDLRHGL